MSVGLVEVVGPGQLTVLGSIVKADLEGRAEFGGFYGRAETRLGPLLGPDRRAWIVSEMGADVGFLDADLEGGVVGLAWFVRTECRRRGVARAALGVLIGMRPWPEARFYSATIDVANLGSRRLAASSGFRHEGWSPDGAEIWRRPT